jgi:hypothetical protein
LGSLRSAAVTGAGAFLSAASLTALYASAALHACATLRAAFWTLCKREI